MSKRDQCGLCLRPRDHLVHDTRLPPGAPVREIARLGSAVDQADKGGPSHTFVPFCDHKFVDTHICLKCGVSAEDLEKHSGRSS